MDANIVYENWRSASPDTKWQQEKPLIMAIRTHVWNVAKRFFRERTPEYLPDIESRALQAAFMDFDASRGTKFSTFLHNAILNICRNEFKFSKRKPLYGLPKHFDLVAEVSEVDNLGDIDAREWLIGKRDFLPEAQRFLLDEFLAGRDTSANEREQLVYHLRKHV